MHTARVVASSFALLLAAVAPASAGQEYAVEVTTGALNVRASMGGRLLGQVHSGRRFVVFQERSGWSQISWQGYQAWVASRYVQRVSARAERIDVPALNVRTGPTSSASRLGIVRDTQAYVRLETRGGWHLIQFDDRRGWVAGWLTQTLALNNSAAPTSTAAASTTGRRMSATQSELEILARIIKGEAGVATYEGKVAVGAVVLNRVRSRRHPDTIRGVVHQPWQFSAYNRNVRDRLYWGSIPQSCWDAARDALNGWDPTYGATFYFNPYLVLPSWANGMTRTVRIGTRPSDTHDFYRP